MTTWSGRQRTRVVRKNGEELVSKEFEEGVVYSNSKGWMTKKIFQEELKRFSKYLARTKPGEKNIILLDNFSGHLINPSELGITNLELAYFRPNSTGHFQPLVLGLKKYI